MTYIVGMIMLRRRKKYKNAKWCCSHKKAPATVIHFAPSKVFARVINTGLWIIVRDRPGPRPRQNPGTFSCRGPGPGPGPGSFKICSPGPAPAPVFSKIIIPVRSRPRHFKKKLPGPGPGPGDLKKSVSVPAPAPVI